MIEQPLVSVIMPAYNVQLFIDHAIRSVQKQSYENWELLIINDGSTDDTKKIIKSYNDPRIKYFEQENSGVGAARNIGLKFMHGDFFCFLDSDDLFCPNSLYDRLRIFESNADLSFVDGAVEYVDEKLNPLSKKYCPDFTGFPFDQLLTLNSNCLFGNTWMIKRNFNEYYNFETDMSHAEDLFFYLTICNNKLYNYTTKAILLYRQRNDSAMKDLKGLESGYLLLINKIRTKLKVNIWSIFRLKLIIMKIMILSFIFDGNDILSAIKAPFKILRA